MILDTNAISAMAEGETGVMERFAATRELSLPVIVLGEYRFGIAKSRRRREYERWLGEMISLVRVLEVNKETAVCYARVRTELKEAGTPIPSNDVWIAALCRQHALPLLSRDQHFDLIRGFRRLDW